MVGVEAMEFDEAFRTLLKAGHRDRTDRDKER